jgi:hypothetical protein
MRSRKGLRRFLLDGLGLVVWITLRIWWNHEFKWMKLSSLLLLLECVYDAMLLLEL